ncbi:oxidoreductase [bacterium 336/3]|nr:oxidoreductase [bacterium 336/3]
MNVLIVGLGSIAHKHIDAVRKINPNASVFALRSGKVETEYVGVSNILDIKELNEKPDFIIISNPTYKHKDAIDLVTSVNTPIFIEKPLAESIIVAQEIRESINSKNIINYVACNLRFHQCLQFVFDYLKNNQFIINEVNSYCGSYLPNWRPHIDFKQNYSANEDMGGGVHLDLIHELDYIYWFFGLPLKVDKFLRKKSSLGINAVDYANYVLEYENFTASVILNYYRQDTKRTCEIVCSDRTLIIDLLHNNVKLNDELLFSSNERISDTYLHQMNYFWSCIKENKQTLNTIDNALDVLKICL